MIGRGLWLGWIPKTGIKLIEEKSEIIHFNYRLRKYYS